MKNNFFQRKPEWLRIKLPHGVKSAHVCGTLNGQHLNSICTSGLCPNRGECWTNGTATFMIGGDTCTRSCRFCNVATGRPLPLDPGEPERVAQSIKSLGLRHAVVTSVDRDDLPDYGAAHWAETVQAIHALCPGVTIETLIPDFNGRLDLADLVIDAAPDVISHNMETVRRLTPEVRCHATYDCSLSVLSHIADRGVRAKSGIMLGLGETEEEIIETMADLRNAGCSVLTIGQYLQPTEHHYEVREYVTPEKFEEYRLRGLEMGFRHVESAPLVRSSYHAERHVL